MTRPHLIFVTPHFPLNPLTANYNISERELQDNEDKDFLLDGIKSGFQIVDLSFKPQQVECENYKSATWVKNRENVEKQILEEIAEGTEN